MILQVATESMITLRLVFNDRIRGTWVWGQLLKYSIHLRHLHCVAGSLCLWFVVVSPPVYPNFSGHLFLWIQCFSCLDGNKLPYALSRFSCTHEFWKYHIHFPCDQVYHTSNIYQGSVVCHYAVDHWMLYYVVFAEAMEFFVSNENASLWWYVPTISNNFVRVRLFSR